MQRTRYVVLAIIHPRSVLQLLQLRQNLAHGRGRLVAADSIRGAQCELSDATSECIQVHCSPVTSCRLSEGGSSNGTADVATLQVRRARLKLQSEQTREALLLPRTCSQ